jgi:hypothetical protein
LDLQEQFWLKQIIGHSEVINNYEILQDTMPPSPALSNAPLPQNPEPTPALQQDDYFHESGFDAAEFTPKAAPPLQRTHTNQAVIGLSRADLIAANKSTRISMDGSMQTQDAPISSFTEDDWVAIQRARRTHVHTRLAIQKLATLVVGEMKTLTRNSQDLTSTSLTDDSENVFDPHQYIRYAITGKTIESPTSSTAPFFRLRFCVLYPYDTRSGQPSYFLPGNACL